MAARIDKFEVPVLEPGGILMRYVARRPMAAADVRCLTGRCNVSKAKSEKTSPDLDTPTDIPPEGVNKISASLNTLLADAFALYLKTKNFHWHVSGRHFHDYHLMLDEQSDAIFATTDQLAERVRKLARGHHAALDRRDRQAADHQ